jgi:hypothetical protein
MQDDGANSSHPWNNIIEFVCEQHDLLTETAAVGDGDEGAVLFVEPC